MTEKELRDFLYCIYRDTQRPSITYELVGRACYECWAHRLPWVTTSRQAWLCGN
jgi:hypothetical protein